MSVLSGVLATKLPVFAPQRGAARLEWSEFVLRDICIVVAMALAPFCMLHFLRGNIVLALLNTACLAMLAATICRLHFRSATALDGSMIIALGGITVPIAPIPSGSGDFGDQIMTLIQVIPESVQIW